MATREQFEALFETAREADEYQESWLQHSDEDLLPEYAAAVLRGEEPTEEYWQLLIDEWRQQEWEASLHKGSVAPEDRGAAETSEQWEARMDAADATEATLAEQHRQGRA